MSLCLLLVHVEGVAVICTSAAAAVGESVASSDVDFVFLLVMVID